MPALPEAYRHRRIKGITARVVLFVAIASVAPLVLFGVVAVNSLRAGTRRSVAEGNLNVARQAAEQVGLYVTTNVSILRAVAANIQRTGLEQWQQDRILKNYVLSFPQFRELTLFDEAGRVVATSRVGTPGVQVPGADAIDRRGAHITPVALDDDLLPRTTVGLPINRFDRAAGWLVGEFNLVEMWRMVDRIRIGEHGFAIIVVEGDRVIAHGNPDQKAIVARGEALTQHPLLHRAAGAARVAEYDGTGSTRYLGVAAPIASLNWMVIVEQPTWEAYAAAGRLEKQLAIAIAVVLAVTILFGYFWGRSFIRPILALMTGTRALASGEMDARVNIEGEDEFGQLGEAFNSMADRLVVLQADVRKQERQAMFGRIAVGLVHDLSHPIQNLQNSCRLILRSEDPDYREIFRRTVDREFKNVKRVLEDLRNLARPIPLARFPIDVNRSVADVVESMRAHADTAGLTIVATLAPAPIFIEGDLFAIGRVYRNLIMNSIQATEPGGQIEVSTALDGPRVRITIADTGCGIPPERLAAVFDDFMTTKRSGLGLGLAISKKIIEQLDGRITVTSEVRRGSTFVLEFETIPAP